MRIFKHGSVVLLFLVIAVSGFAQSTPAADDQTAPANVPQAGGAVRHRTRHILCWKEAGLTPDMVNQRWRLEDDQKGEIAAVCRDPKTNAQQKHDKIEQIHANTEQAIGQLIGSEKLAKFNKCEANLPKTRPDSLPQKELGPCGGAIPAQGADEMHGMEH